MEITIYELLGMIKEGNVPKEIEYEKCLLSWDNVDKDYYCEKYNNLFEYLFSEYQTTELLNFTVEILEEEKKIPEKLFGEPRHIYNENELYIVGKVNEIIDYLKSKGE